ncbi:MAG: tetratricopeptide repeat protein, partial [Candidatus Firestonebacteria bacterium]
YRFIVENFPAKAQEARYWIGNCYYSKGDFETAAAEYLKVESTGNTSGIWTVTAKARAAECFERLGKYERAKELYEEIIKKSGNKDWAESAEKRRNALKKATEEVTEQPALETTKDRPAVRPAKGVKMEESK